MHSSDGNHADADQRRRGARVPAVQAALTPADVAALLASQPTPPLPGHLAAKVTAAIAAESAQRGIRHEPRPVRHEPVMQQWPSLPRSRTGMPLPSRELLVPVPRDAWSHA